MKIVHVVDHHFEHLGYEVTYLTQAQKLLGHDVSIIASDLYIAPDGGKGRRTGSYDYKGIRTYRLRSFAVVGPRRWLVGLRRLLLQLSPEVVHQHGAVDLTAVRVAVHQKRIGYTLVSDCHAADFNSRYDSLLHRSAYYVFRHTGGRLVKSRAGALTAIGENEQAFLCRALRLPPASVPIIRLGVDVHQFKFSAEDRISLRTRLGYCDDDVVTIHVGSVRPNKRLDLLLRVVQTLRRAQLKVRALIVAIGTPDVLTALRTDVSKLGLEEHVRVMDFVKPTELSAYYSAADIAIWPGDISIAALEAIAVGLPLIGVDDPYVRRITKNGNGLTFTRGSESDLLDRCFDLVRDSQLRRRLGQLGRQFAVSELAWEIMAAKYLQLYASSRRPT